MSTLEKPCNQKCYINDDDICLGCYRTLSDILAWKRINVAQKEEILQRSVRCQENYFRQNNISKKHWSIHNII